MGVTQGDTGLWDMFGGQGGMSTIQEQRLRSVEGAALPLSGPYCAASLLFVGLYLAPPALPKR